MKIFVPMFLSLIAGTTSGQKFPVAAGYGAENQPVVIDAETLIKFGLIHGKSDPIPPKLNFYQYPNGKLVKRMDNFEPGALAHIAIPEPQYAAPAQPNYQAAIAPPPPGSGLPGSSFALPFQLAASGLAPEALNAMLAGGVGPTLQIGDGLAGPGNGQMMGQGQNPGMGPQGPVIPAAVISNHKIAHYDTIPSLVNNPNNQAEPTTIDVPANVIPVNFIFRSASSVINVEHKHEGATGSFKETLSTDEPHQLHHTVQKPIIQQVREIISPYRKVIQEVEPVREEIDTMVAKGMFKAAHGLAQQHSQEQQMLEAVAAHQAHHQAHQQHHHQHHHNLHQHANKHYIDNNDYTALGSETKHSFMKKGIPSISSFQTGSGQSKGRLVSFKPNMMSQFGTSGQVFNYKSTSDMFANARSSTSGSPVPLGSTSGSVSGLHHPFAFQKSPKSFFMTTA